MAARRTVHLAAARPGAHVQNRGPKALDPSPCDIGLYNVGGANARALPAPDAAVEKLGFGQRPRRSNQSGIVILAELSIYSQHRYGDYSARCRRDESPAGQVGRDGLA